MEKVFAFLKAHIKSSMEIFIMGNLRGRDNYILPQEIIILDNLDLIKNKAAEYIIGLVKRAMFTKVSSRLVREMEREPSGGVMEVGIKGNLETEYKVGGGFCIVKEDIDNTREIGIMECLTEKEYSIFRTVSAMREPSNKTNSMEKEYSTKTTLLYMEFGRTTNYQLLIW